MTISITAGNIFLVEVVKFLVESAHSLQELYAYLSADLSCCCCALKGLANLHDEAAAACPGMPTAI